jgi:arginyl-tRNA synthetase
VHRTNFGGDVGLHVARAMWAILQNLGGENPDSLSGIEQGSRASYISARYVEGSTAYEGSADAKIEIDAINKRIYALHASGDTQSAFARIYFTCRQWSKDYFVDFYKQIQVTEFEKYYPESITHERGIKEVSSRVGTVFKKSDGAIVFEGEEYGLHTRVFITSEGLPTYEAKDIGLIFTETEEFKFDHRVLFTGRDQQEYMRVVWKAMDQISPGIEAKMTHIVNGIVKFGDGRKMSSRSGNVTTATDVIESVRSAVGDSGDKERDERIYLGALKYEFLKHRLEGDMSFDPKESVSLHGNSGPYLQYAAVRAKSILQKLIPAYGDTYNIIVPADDPRFDPGERLLVRKLAEYSSILEVATKEYAPYILCIYLYDLAQVFNQFYEKSTIIGDTRERLRWEILSRYYGTLQDGLSMLGIEVPQKM